ncbi:MAG: 3-phosphoglycerate dehydrogenase family protein [Coriobacteriales bacterium]|nr:3-phosphoglycerate dehydrogenase family protein [Coriobacteriales bacterium]
MYRVHCINNIAKVGTDALGEQFALTDNASQADAILVRSANLHEMDFSNKLLAIARAGAGVNNIPLERCAEQGVVVFNTPGANANGVKELVIAGMLLAARDIRGGIEWVNRHSDDPQVGVLAEKAKNRFAGTELAGKTLGVIGLGAIGAMVANAGRSLGMHVMGYDPYLSVKYAWSLDRHVRHVNDLKDIWANADYITIHIPATDATRGIISRKAIAAMKDDVVVLNYARDVLVDERAMAEALQEGHVSHYMTDFANANSTQMPRAIVTPHLGASTKEAEDNCAIMAANEIRDYLENGNITNSVNYGTVDLGPITTPMRLAVFHKNVPGVIGQITSAISAAGVNIENMTDKSMGDNAYSLLDLSGVIDDSIESTLMDVDGIYRVRVIHGKFA